jgi:4,5-dihydroxyphthalate decarboxylase
VGSATADCNEEWRQRKGNPNAAGKASGPIPTQRRSLERLFDPAVSRYPLAWLPTYARKMHDLFDGDPFPYGIEENRPTLEQFLRYTHEQGIAHRHAKPEEIFPQGIMTSVRV